MNKNILLAVCMELLISSVFWVNQANADNMESSSYKIQFGNFNMTSGEKNSSSYSITDTVGQTAAGPFDSTGYAVRSGFQYIYPFDDFSFQISSLTVDFGELSLNTFKTATHTLSVVTGSATGYVVQAAETHPLQTQSASATIPDTTCDNGICTETTAQTWTSPVNPGFGFNVNGDDIEADFISTDYFRQFANLNGAETKKTIMSANPVSSGTRTATVTYKVAIDSTQDDGQYETVIQYTAIPSY